MQKDATISLRIDSDLKNDVEKILKSLGIPMTTAITMYFNQIKMRNGIHSHLLFQICLKHMKIILKMKLL